MAYLFSTNVFLLVEKESKKKIYRYMLSMLVDVRTKERSNSNDRICACEKKKAITEAIVKVLVENE